MTRYLFILTPFLTLPLLTLAQTQYQPLVGIPGVTTSGDGRVDFDSFINSLYALSIGIAALLAVIKIVIAGVKYMLTDIVTGKEEAKKDIKGALLGLLVVMGAVLILTVINPQLVAVNFNPTPTNTPEYVPGPSSPLTGLEPGENKITKTTEAECEGRWVADAIGSELGLCFGTLEIASVVIPGGGSSYPEGGVDINMWDYDGGGRIGNNVARTIPTGWGGQPPDHVNMPPGAFFRGNWTPGVEAFDETGALDLCQAGGGMEPHISGPVSMKFKTPRSDQIRTGNFAGGFTGQFAIGGQPADYKPNAKIWVSLTPESVPPPYPTTEDRSRWRANEEYGVETCGVGGVVQGGTGGTRIYVIPEGKEASVLVHCQLDPDTYYYLNLAPNQSCEYESTSKKGCAVGTIFYGPAC